MSKKGLLIYGTDNDIGFLGKLVEKIVHEHPTIIDSFPLNTSNTTQDINYYITEHFERLKKKIDSEHYDFLVIMSHGKGDCIYWGKFNGVRKLLIGDNSLCKKYRNIFESHNIILFSCFSNGKVGTKLKNDFPSSNILSFGDINTEIIDYTNPSEIPIAVPGRKHVIRHIINLITYIFYQGISAYIKTNKIIDIEYIMKKETLKIIYNIYNNQLPIGVENDFEKLKDVSKNFIRITLIKFYIGIEMK